MKCTSKVINPYSKPWNWTSEGSADGMEQTSTLLDTWINTEETDLEGSSETFEPEPEESGESSGVSDCERMVDIVFALDSSESIGPINFRAIKTYTKEILKGLDLADCDNVGIINFNEFANSEKYLTPRQSQMDVIARIDALEGPPSYLPSENKTRIHLALLVANEILFTNQLGSRNASEKFLVIMTDGYQTKPNFDDEQMSDERLLRALTEKDVRVLVLAIGDSASIPEFLKITTDERNIFPEQRLDELISVVLPKKTLPVNKVAIDLEFEDIKEKSEAERNSAN